MEEKQTADEVSHKLLEHRPSRPFQNVDDLYNKLGDPGRLQVVLFWLLAFCFIICSSNHVVGVFFGASPAYYCNASFDLMDTEVQNETADVSYTLSDVNSTIVNVLRVSHDQCSVTVDLGGVSNVTKSCTSGQWVYDVIEREATTVTEFDLVCDHAYLSDLASSLYYLGVMLGGFVCGYISDVFGRKLVVMATLVLSLVVGGVIAFAHHFVLFVVMRIIMGALMQGLLTSSFILAIELFPLHHRSFAGVTMQCMWGVGMLYLGGVAWGLRDWRHIQLALLGPVIFSTCTIWFQPESLRWLLARGKTHRASLVIEKFASFNKLPNPVGDEHTLLADYKVHYVKNHASYMTLIRTPNLRKRTLCMNFIWFAANIGYFGMTYNSSQLAGDKYLNFFLGAIMDTVVQMLGGVAVVKFGRKKPLMFCFLAGAVCCLVSGLIPRDSDGHVTGSIRVAMIVFSVLGRSLMCGLFVVVDIFASELFPTVVRNMGVGLCTFMARIGAAMAPQLFVLKRYTFAQLPPVLIAILAVIGAALTLLLPETSGKHLPDTVEDVETEFGWTAGQGNPSSLSKSKEMIKNGNSHTEEVSEKQNGHLFSNRYIDGDNRKVCDDVESNVDCYK